MRISDERISQLIAYHPDGDDLFAALLDLQDARKALAEIREAFEHKDIARLRNVEAAATHFQDVFCNLHETSRISEGGVVMVEFYKYRQSIYSWEALRSALTPEASNG